MKLIGFGSNLQGNGKSPQENCQEAIFRLSQHKITILRTSSFFESAPIPDSTQPWYINSVASISTELAPLSLLKYLLAVESEMGRRRGVKNAPRIIDLDLLAYDDQVIELEQLIVPHPKIRERGFVLRPLAQVAPDWVHPVCGKHIKLLIQELDPGQIVHPIEG